MFWGCYYILACHKINTPSSEGSANSSYQLCHQRGSRPESWNCLPRNVRVWKTKRPESCSSAVTTQSAFLPGTPAAAPRSEEHAVFVSSSHARPDCVCRLFCRDECVLQRGVFVIVGSVALNVPVRHSAQMWRKRKTSADTHTPTHTASARGVFLGHHLAEWLDKFSYLREAFEVPSVIGWMDLWLCRFACWQFRYFKLL